ncbi:uncharacterized protein [Rutidosis leptorrhynchoides]|uniref:uncharacterized protein n=1 Tax=Rutidosis leptorrhynchoides TaxID=125765 RepID=UPI003A9A0F2B
MIVATVEEGGSCWMTPYMKYLQDGTLLDDVTEARWIKVSAPLYVLENGVLYRKSFNGPNLRCLTPQQAADVVKEMHDVSSAWPFCKWAIDIVGLFPRSVGNAKFLVVAIDFSPNVLKQRYGLPNEIVCDNGKQFADNPFKSWCEELSIKQTFTSVAHPKANSQVDVTNKEIVAGIKARLGLSQTKRIDEVPYILWAHRTAPKWSTGETPFNLVYGTNAVIPAEICVPTQRVLAFDVEKNSSVLRENLNLLEERRIMAAIRQADAKQRMEKYYNKWVRHVQFREGYLVLRVNEESRQAKQGKMGSRWEGPYKIIKAHPNGSYTLAAPSDEELQRTWNAMSLKKFYA